jgi:hypothetical protein
MDYINILVGLGALLIALRALNLQRKEIIKNGKITALIHASQLIQEKIDYHNRIIDDNKTKKEWKDGHKNKINHKLRPLKSNIDLEFINIVSEYDGVLHEDKLRDILEIGNK